MIEVMSVEDFHDKFYHHFNEHMKKYYGIELRQQHSKLSFETKRLGSIEPTARLVCRKNNKDKDAVKGDCDKKHEAKEHVNLKPALNLNILMVLKMACAKNGKHSCRPSFSQNITLFPK